MTVKQRRKAIIVFVIIAAVFMAGSIALGSGGAEEETIQEVMRDSVLHDLNKISLFGLMDVNPGLVAGVIVSAFLIVSHLYAGYS